MSQDKVEAVERALTILNAFAADKSQLTLAAGASAHVLLAFSDAKSAKPKSAKANSVQDQGYAVSLGERDPHVAAVAVPVFDTASRFRGALAISGLIARFDEKERRAALTELLASANRLAQLSRLEGCEEAK